jgi:hypothetical protein
VANHLIHTGLKLATCMECGSQDRPKEVEKLIKEKEEKAWKEEAIRREMERRREEERRYELRPHRQLLAEWLQQFNRYARGEEHEYYRQYRDDVDREWRDHRERQNHNRY